MKLALAVHFQGEAVWVGAAVFDDWDDAEASRTCLCRAAPGPAPARGAPDLRALPGLLQLLQANGLAPSAIVIDGLVHLDAADTPGLGRALYDALGGRTPVIGLSTRAAPGLPAQFEVFRQDEAAPVRVTCAGVDLGAAKARIRTMHGKRRVPTLLKLAVRTARSGHDAGAAGLTAATS